MILKPNPVPASRFMWSAEEARFYAEMSDIGGFGLVYDDAIDVGFTLESRYPGKNPIVFVVERTERDSDGDVVWWDLIPADLRERDRTGFSVRIWND